MIITGNPSQTSQRTAMNLGADDYLTKPFTTADVLECAETRLKRADIHWRVENQALQNLHGSLHTTLPHEFFTPLVGIIGMNELLMEKAGELSRDEIVDLAGNINRSGDRLHRTLRNYLRILDLDQMPVTAAAPLSPVQTQSTVTHLARSVATRHKREADLDLALTAAASMISTDSLGLIVEELADNAFGFSRQGTPVRIEVAAGSDNFTLRFTDRGRGMTPEQIEKIGAFQ